MHHGEWAPQEAIKKALNPSVVPMSRGNLDENAASPGCRGAPPELAGDDSERKRPDDRVGVLLGSSVCQSVWVRQGHDPHETE
jgi:hypothetical protein